MSIDFTINGKAYSVKPEDYPADITLSTFIREHAKLFGTKFYCLEGGCGVCTVTVRSHHLVTHRYSSWGVNACLVLLNVCHGWDIITIEGLGDRNTGYHPLQERLAHFNGSQCGYCSPGMIMHMFSILEASEGKLSAEQIENSFGGNLCRCTGYRPILDTMKSFATDTDYEFIDTQNDIEDLKRCSRIGKICEKICRNPCTQKFHGQRVWYHPHSLHELFYVMINIKNRRYMLVAGNTAHGVYRRDPSIEVFIHVNNVPELRDYTVGEVLELGGNMTLTEVMNVMEENTDVEGFEYLSEVLKHLDLVAHIQVRNIGTIAGNLMIKHEHHDFPSDIFLLLNTIGARIFIVHSSGVTKNLSPSEFLTCDMHQQIILKVAIPKMNKQYTLFGSYKILPRAQNAHAHVNAGFCFTLSSSTVVSSRLCFGGIHPEFNASIATIDYLHGRDLFSASTLAEVLDILEAELQADWILPAPSPEYRKKVALGLFYKFILKHCRNGLVKPTYVSGGQLLQRPLSNGAQNLDTKQKYWPINKPVRKLEAMWQCSGEAVYPNDIPYISGEVWAAFVTATKVLSTVVQIDATEALSIPGVVAFYSAKDIPGSNSFVTPGLFAIIENEELFCAGLVKYHSQPVGIILAKTNDLANYAATKVKIWYEHSNSSTAAQLSLKKSITMRGLTTYSKELDANAPAGTNVAANIQIRGYFDMGSQFHFSMETQTTICIPREGGLLLYPASHYIDLVQVSIANTLKIKENQIDIEVRRLGGSYGCKISRSNQVAVACALASWLSNLPVRFVQRIEPNMKISGKRLACSNFYTTAVNAQGKIQSLAINFYEDMGNSNNESPLNFFTLPSISNCYEKTSSWEIKGNEVLTDAPSNTWCRAPGTLEGIAMIENIMEHIARVVKKDPVDVRMTNIPVNSPMRKLFLEFIKNTEYRERRKAIDIFNQENRWRKRGVAISIMRYGIFYFGNISATVAIYHFDGSVAISHGGVEVGQGINTKAAQVAAYTFGIPLDMVTVKASNSLDGANSIATGGSVGSETVCYAVEKACKELLSRMKPVRDKMKRSNWLEIVKKCHETHINLVSREIHKAGDLDGYDVWGLACSEIEVDVITGNFQLTRVDILEDTGESLSPLVDVGQVEGAFVMGLGYWLTEKLVYDNSTGELLTNRTWNYKVPGMKDIPIDFRVTLLQKNPNSKGFLRSKVELIHSLEINNTSQVKHLRKRRYVSFPEGSSFTVAICTTIGVIGNPNVNFLSYALNWGVAYNLPNDTITLPRVRRGTDDMDASFLISKSHNRRNLLQEAEKLIESIGYNGTECILKASCESFMTPKRNTANMVDKIFDLLMRPFKNKFSQRSNEYKDAAADCSQLYPGCILSFRDLVDGKYSLVKSKDYPPDITLNTFLRKNAQLSGTKAYCLEGGCGTCTVTARTYHPVTHKYYTRGVNSCLVLLNVCHGWDIITIEGIGNRRDGYHPIQERLAHFNGSQCGFCSPGMVMNMFSNLEAKDGRMTADEIENSFGGNLCRCTGYRPILDTMKSFASNSEYEFIDSQPDIEDLKLCPRMGTICQNKCMPALLSEDVNDQRSWYFPRSLQELYDILANLQTDSYMLVAGNTANGVYRRDPDIEVFIDVNNVPELRKHDIGDTLELGGNVTLAEMIEILEDASSLSGFEYFKHMLRHLDLVAHIQVRNTGTIAGNLMIKYKYYEFISDIFLLLTTVAARIVIGHYSGRVEEMSLPDFLRFDMRRQVILKVILPELNKDTTIFRSYKILPRAQNSQAYVNAGFLFTLSGPKIQTSRICFGGINPGFIEASATMEYLKGRTLFSPETFSEALDILNAELEPDWVLPAPSPEYRKRLALGLFYKFFLRTAPRGLIKREYVSGGRLLKRPLSSGVQYFDTKREHWPVNQPVRKLEALWQTSGEADYTDDVPSMRGVTAFYSAKDIPGVNSFVAAGLFGIIEDEELFCAGVVKYHSQPVGIILAKSNSLANYAATKVRIMYERNRDELLVKPTVKDIVERKGCSHADLQNDVEGRNIVGSKRIKGHFEMGGQFHFSLESHTTVCIPRDNGLLIYPSSHYVDLIQASVARALNLKENQVDIIVRRLGGSFGSKISRSNHVAVACALGCQLSNRPVRFVQTIESNMKTSGKRNACICDYSVTVSDQGKIQSLKNTFYEDLGCSINESPIPAFTIPAFPNCYEKTNSWDVRGTEVLTDAPSHSWTRAPGTLEGIAMMENIIEHIASSVKKDPVDVRLANIPSGSEMRKLLPDFVKSTDYRQRRKEIDDFNQANRWRKRGIAISIMRYPLFYFSNISAFVAIYHYDGSVAISHGGVECGQGINTKAAQVAARTFGISLDMVTVKATDSLAGANSVITGGSVTSETVCFAVQKACKELIARMKPIRDQLKNPTWLEVVKKSFEQNINLVSRQIHKVGDMKDYDVFGLACAEMEVDILTGNFQLTRVDILEDTGESLNPLIDVGQIEGAYVMGLGYWLTEKLVYDRQTGKLKTFRTWDYKVPTAKDIPIDFRVKLYQKRPNPNGFLGSKATGELAITLSISSVFALRHAIDSARKDSGLNGWYHLGAPTTIEDVVLAAGHRKSDFKLFS